MTTPRSASALLLCLGIAAIAAMIGIAFLRATSRLAMSGPNEVMIALARDAALSGVAHATEQIFGDYNATDLSVAYDGGARTVTGAPTFLDGPYRAPFVSSLDPNRLFMTQDGKPVVTDDVPEENNLLLPFVRRKWDIDHAGWHYRVGSMIYDGRGRYIEVGYHNRTRPDPTVASPVPVDPIGFTDLSAATPTQGNGLFLDASLRRVTSGTVADQRQEARYRLRYALGVEDLQGHLLSNPQADLEWDWRTTDNGYRKPEPWLDAAAYAWQNMIACSFNDAYLNAYSAPQTTSLRMGHIFRGRGSATNADRRWSAGDARYGYPATFPMMFRAADQTDPDGRQFWGSFAYAGDLGGAPTNLGGRLYQHAAWSPWAAIIQNPDGGEVLTPIRLRYPSSSTRRCPTYAHALLGPQLSWYNQYFAVQGFLQWGIDNSWKGEDGNSNGADGPHWSSARSRFLTVPSPFGRGTEVATGGSRTWYQGDVATPWLVNVLTAAPQTVSQMILAYMYPEIKTYSYDRREKFNKTGEVSTTDAYGNTYITEVYSSTPDVIEIAPNAGLPVIRAGPGALDILNDQLGSGVADFPAPSSMHDANRRVKPDYYQADPYTQVTPATPPYAGTTPIDFAQRYPGPLARGDSTVASPIQGSDDLGRLIDTDENGVGLCSHTGMPFLIYGAKDDVSYETGPLAPWLKRLVVLKISPGVASKRHSYMWDLAYALTQAISFARATWVQYPNAVFDPRTGFSPSSLRDFQLAHSVEDLDQLFLRQLGENFTTPGTACADNPIRQVYAANILAAGAVSVTKWLRFQVSATPVSHTIRSLVDGNLIVTPTVSSAERGKVMERVLNDFRLSFLGSSPQYSTTFRPLDFDGDGQVHCSCYPINALATPDESAFKTARWKTADAQGRGPALAPLPVPSPALSDLDPNFGTNPWFCATGTFFIGKSRYYRILCRGEVYDNFLSKPVAAQTLETVLAVDPEGPSDAERATLPAADRPAKNNQVLFQRWHYNDSVSELPRQLR